MISLVVFAAAAQTQGDALQRGPAKGPTGVRAGYSVTPESVRVGDPATLLVRVVAPAGTRLVFPGAVDSTAAVEPLDPVSVKETTTNGVLEAVATYRFLAWELGLPQISLGPIRVDQDGQTQELRLGDPRVFVVTVLPADTTERIPRPSRGIALLPTSNWQWWVLIVGGFFLAGLIGLWLQRRGDKPLPPVDPFAEAQRAFGRLTSLDLIGAGEPAKHVGSAADILRTYLAARATPAGLGLTTAEIVNALKEDAAVPLHRVTEMLGAADAIKFAGATADARNAEALGAEAQSIVAEVHRVDANQPRKDKKQKKKKKT